MASILRVHLVRKAEPNSKARARARRSPPGALAPGPQKQLDAQWTSEVHLRYRPNIGALKIRKGLWEFLYYNCIRNPKPEYY